MKNLYFLTVLLMVCLFSACKDDEKTGLKPGILTECIVTSINGGALITYSIPRGVDALYVMAEYERNGQMFTERASAYENSLKIEGFNTMNPVRTALYVVNRDKSKSEPLFVEFEPLESPISLTYQSMTLETGFAGIIAKWENRAEIELGFRLMVEEDGKLTDKDMYFSTLSSGAHAFRGFDEVEATFAVSIEDKWGNISDTMFLTTIPYFEMQIPSADIKDRRDGSGPSKSGLMFDKFRANSTLTFNRMFNGVTDGDMDSWTTEPTPDYSEMCAFTIDLGAVYKLSRMIMWPRRRYNNPQHVYTVNNVFTFEMWGCKTWDHSKVSAENKAYWLDEFQDWQTFIPWDGFSPETDIPEHTFKDDWVYLGYYEVERLDLAGATDDEIWAKGEEGHHFDIIAEADPVRYIRFFPRSTNLGSPVPKGEFQITELSFFGNNNVPQE
ncbi:MAG: DUF4959 domain-containing protein [Bacteroidales bacterium]|jgi:hypothetical protein|nr:DUF4959 domain-containing protein [Bacteroidales bacterium]